MQLFKVGESIDRDTVLRKLVRLQYERNDAVLTRGSFRVKGEVLEIMPSYAESAYRILLFGDEIEAIHHFDPLTGEILDEVQHVSIWPATHYVTEEDSVERTLEAIRAELDQRLEELESEGKELEAHRLRQRTLYDLEMIKETGFTSGIENYSRVFEGRAAGTPPHTLIDYFPDDFITFIDESHQTIPQIGGMYLGDRSRKTDPRRFRLPPALGDRQPPAQVRRVHGPHEPARPRFGHAGRVRTNRVIEGGRADRPADRHRRSRHRGASRPRTRSTT